MKEPECKSRVLDAALEHNKYMIIKNVRVCKEEFTHVISHYCINAMKINKMMNKFERKYSNEI